MKLEIRNVQSSQTFQIDPEGAVIGREGSQAADIKIRDQSISKRHARIYADGGEWYIEDLGSSNGTFINNKRIDSPVVISPGTSFKLSENSFEVVQLIGGKSTQDESNPLWNSPTNNPPEGRGGRNVSDGMMEDFGRQGAGAMRSSQGPGPSSDGAPSSSEMYEQKGVGYFFIAVPKAIAYYLITIPLMALNPIGTIRKGVNEPKFGAMGPMELIAYALPALIFSALVTSLCAFIAGAIHGVFAFGALIPIVPVISAVIGAVVSGFIWHPVGKWFINKLLKGDSDEVGRSNFFVMSMAATALTAIPNGAAILILSIPVPFIGVAPPVLMAVASLVTLFVSYSWFTSFNVVSWFKYVFMVFGLLTVVNGARLAILGLSTSTAGLASAGSAAGAADVAKAAEAAAAAAAAAGKAGISPEMKEQIQKAQEAAAAAAKAAGANGEAAQKAIEQAKADAAKALAAANKAASDGTALAAAATKEDTKPEAKTPDPKPEAKAPDPKPAEAKTPDPKPEAKAPEPSTKPTKADRSDDARDNGLHPSPTSPALMPSRYKDYVLHRDAVEKALVDDPTLFHRVRSLQKDYEEYHKVAYATAQKAKKKKVEPGLERLSDRQRDLEVFEKTEKMVNDLYKKLYD
jgi:pSer/pThr/pTyr-binding forkhead associated (FHA) protein